MPIQDAPDGTIWVTHVHVVVDTPVPEVPDHEEAITRLHRLTTSSTEYQKVVSWKVSKGKVGILQFVEMESNDYEHTRFRLTIAAKEQFKDVQLEASLALEWPGPRLAAGDIVLLEAKSIDDTEVNMGFGKGKGFSPPVGIDISDADAVEADVREPKTFYSIAPPKKTGTMPTVTLDPDLNDYPEDYHAGNPGGLSAVDVDLIADNIKQGVTIFGVAGSLAAEEHTTRSSSNVEPQLFRPTANNEWQDFDLSKVVPEGATGAIWHLINRESGASRYVGLRKKGSTDGYVGCMKRNTHSWAMVGLDGDRKCQAFAEDYTKLDFLLVGYTGENYTFFTNGYNILPATKKEWVETNIATECPGAIAAIIEFANHIDESNRVGARKHGSTDDRRNRDSHHFWMVVGLDANQHLDLYDEDWPDPPDAANLIGYITAGVTMYTNGADISPTVDCLYHDVSLLGYLANPIIAFIELNSPSVAADYGIRKNPWCADIYYDGDGHNFAIVHPNTPNGLLRINLCAIGMTVHLLGIG